VVRWPNSFGRDTTVQRRVRINSHLRKALP